MYLQDITVSKTFKCRGSYISGKNSDNRKLGKTYRKYTGDTLPDTKTRGKNRVAQKKPGNVFLDRMQRISAPRIRAFSFNLKLGYNSWWLSRRRDSEN